MLNGIYKWCVRCESADETGEPRQPFTGLCTQEHERFFFFLCTSAFIVKQYVFYMLGPFQTKAGYTLNQSNIGSHTETTMNIHIYGQFWVKKISMFLKFEKRNESLKRRENMQIPFGKELLCFEFHLWCHNNVFWPFCCQVTVLCSYKPSGWGSGAKCKDVQMYWITELKNQLLLRYNTIVVLYAWSEWYIRTKDKCTVDCVTGLVFCDADELIKHGWK